jgi:hypothetical protein
MDPGIADVSDTALWIAASRARETARAGALFQDPLAGDRGRELARKMTGAEQFEWMTVVRTVVIDRYLQEAIARGVDTVLNLGRAARKRPCARCSATRCSCAPETSALAHVHRRRPFLQRIALSLPSGFGDQAISSRDLHSGESDEIKRLGNGSSADGHCCVGACRIGRPGADTPHPDARKLPMGPRTGRRHPAMGRRRSRPRAAENSY